jgi:polar amino acid transport system substrate-binding protein
MKYFKFLTLAVALCVVVAFSSPGVSDADTLDKIIASGKLRCGVILDIPPIGFRDANHKPIGYDVEFCEDMAKALGVKAVIVETPGPDRIPALLSKRVDIGVASFGLTLERAKAVAFTIPYEIWEAGVAVRADNDSIKKYEDLIGKKIGFLRGTTSESFYMENNLKEWESKGTSYISFGSNAEQLLALEQGKVDAIVESTAIFAGHLNGAGKGKMKIVCSTPMQSDWAAMAVRRGDQGLLNWVNLFIWTQSKSGRTNELYKKWWGYDAPSMSYPGVQGY